MAGSRPRWGEQSPLPTRQRLAPLREALIWDDTLGLARKHAPLMHGKGLKLKGSAQDAIGAMMGETAYLAAAAREQNERYYCYIQYLDSDILLVMTECQAL